MFNIIPAIDIIDGKVVRLKQGDYAQKTEYSLSPVETAIAFEKAGATRIHLVDLDGAKAGKIINIETLKQIRASVNCELEVGGGIRNESSIQELLSIGINFVILGSILIKDFSKASTLIKKFPNKIVAGLDTKEGKISINGWLEDSPITLEDLLPKLESLPIDSVIFTDIATDGMMQGPNLEALKKIVSQTTLPIIASGGVSSLEDISKLKTISPALKGAITGKAVLSGTIDLKLIWQS